MLNNVTLKESETAGKVSWKLLDPEGKPIDAFATFADSLIRKHPLTTRRSYCRHLAEFIDYLIEAANSLHASGEPVPLARETLQEIIESYDDYLIYGDQSGNRIACLVHETRPSQKVKAATSAPKHAAIRKFLKLSESLRRQMLELAEAGLRKAIVDGMPLLSGGAKEPISHQRRQAMIGSSMIAGVISGGPRFADAIVLPTQTAETVYDDRRAFPFDKIADFISHLTTSRDQALYAFLAASGCRISEGLQAPFARMKSLSLCHTTADTLECALSTVLLSRRSTIFGLCAKLGEAMTTRSCPR